MYGSKKLNCPVFAALNFWGIWKQTWWLFSVAHVFVPKTSQGFQYIFLFWLDLGFLKEFAILRYKWNGKVNVFENVNVYTAVY